MYAFSMDNPFFRFVGRVVDLVWINIMTLICCIPVVTAGAALSAMYKILIQIVSNEEGAITRGYFRAFRENLKNATKIWFPALAALLVLGGNAFLIYKGVLKEMGTLQTMAGVSIGILAGVLIVFLQYALALIARFDAGLKQSLKNAILLEVAFFPRSLCILAILFFPVALMLLSNYFLWFWFLYGISIPGYFISMILHGIFTKTDSIHKEENHD